MRLVRMRRRRTRIPQLRNRVEEPRAEEASGGRRRKARTKKNQQWNKQPEAEAGAELDCQEGTKSSAAKARVASQAQSFSLQEISQDFITLIGLPKSPSGVCCRGTRGVLSSRRSASLFQRAGSSSQPSGPWPHTSPSCWPSGRSHTGEEGAGLDHRLHRAVNSLSTDPHVATLGFHLSFQPSLKYQSVLYLTLKLDLKFIFRAS